MRYFGGKARIAKQIANFLESERKENQSYLEPFVGGGWVTQYITGKRFALDKHPYLIAMYQEIQKGWVPPKEVTREEYYEAKDGDVPDYLKGFIGFGCSFAGKWFGGYAYSKSRNYCLNAHNSVMKKMETMKDVTFACRSYDQLTPKGFQIYCDPPYKGTTGYGLVGTFDSDNFWETMRQWSKTNDVYISEYNAPDDFEVVWQQETKTDIRNKDNQKEKRIEKLFKYKGDMI